MIPANRTDKTHAARSNFIRRLVQHTGSKVDIPPIFAEAIPKKIVQFWDNLQKLPDDVYECIQTWKILEKQGIEQILFDAERARDYIHRKLGVRYERAYDKCYHPAMQSDYFRLCYILLDGGCYIDADDTYNGKQIEPLFSDGRLKIQPLCYDTATHSMVQPLTFIKVGANAPNWIFYFNNNPLIASSGHPLIKEALSLATLYLEENLTNNLPEIQSTTGPGVLTQAIFETISDDYETEQMMKILCNWEDVATSRWPLSYRNDDRNWRLSNCRAYSK